jgi:predicted transport protein
MNASLLAGIHANGGKPVYGDTRDLLENQLAVSDSMTPVFESLVEFVLQIHPDATILPKKTYVSILAKREFAAINIKKSELRLGLDLGARPFDENVTKSKLTGPMPRISHQVTIADNSRLDAGLAGLLKDSYSRSN